MSKSERGLIGSRTEPLCPSCTMGDGLRVVARSDLPNSYLPFEPRRAGDIRMEENSRKSWLRRKKLTGKRFVARFL